MASTYEKIATTTLGSSQGTVTFSSIPATYTDLIIILNTTGTGSGVKSLQFNSDTSSNYSCTVLYGDGSAAGSARYSVGYIDIFNSTTAQNANIIQINNYSNSTTYKTYLSRQNTAAVSVEAIVGLWRSTSAINAVSLVASTNNWASGSIFTIYGIKAA